MKPRFTTTLIAGGVRTLANNITAMLNTLPPDYVVVAIVPTHYFGGELATVEVVIDSQNPLVDSSDRALGIKR